MEPLVAQAGITLISVITGGRIIMNGIYKRLDDHKDAIGQVSSKVGELGERVSRIEGLNEKH